MRQAHSTGGRPARPPSPGAAPSPRRRGANVIRTAPPVRAAPLPASLATAALAAGALAATAVAATAATACQARRDVEPVEVVLHDAGGAATLRLTRTAAGCRADLDGATADQAGPLVITVAGDTASAGAWRLGPGPAGRELRGEVGLVARVVAEPGRLSLVDPIGVPLVRLALTAERATAVDASRAPVGAVERHGDRHRLLAGPAGDTVAGTVSGTTDLELAARLLAPAPLPLPARALLACDRLAAVTPAAK